MFWILVTLFGLVIAISGFSLLGWRAHLRNEHGEDF